MSAAVVPPPMSPEQYARAKQNLERLIMGLYKLAELEKRLNQIVIKQEEYARALVNGVATKEHVALISPPGTAKSYLVKMLAKAIQGANFYQTLLNPFIDYDQLFGPIDVAKLAKEGKAVRRWSNLVRADFAFLDEGFKANPALLNSLLSLLNERIVYDPYTGAVVNTPLKTAVVASNEVPEDPSLRALWDRIVIRVYGKYLENPEDIQRALLSYWRNRVKIEGFITKQEVEEIENLVEEVLRNPALDSMLGELITGLPIPFTELYKRAIVNTFQKAGITVSTRTYVQKLPKIFLTDVMLSIMQGLPASLAIVQSILRIARYLAEDESEVEANEEKATRELGTRIVNLYNRFVDAINKGDAEELANIAKGLENEANEARAVSSSDILHTLLYMMMNDARKYAEKIGNKAKKNA